MFIQMISIDFELSSVFNDDHFSSTIHLILCFDFVDFLDVSVGFNSSASAGV